MNHCLALPLEGLSHVMMYSIHNRQSEVTRQQEKNNEQQEGKATIVFLKER